MGISFLETSHVSSDFAAWMHEMALEDWTQPPRGTDAFITRIVPFFPNVLISHYSLVSARDVALITLIGYTGVPASSVFSLEERSINFVQ